MPPQFSSKSYWDSRFASEPGSFDWLLPASALDSLLRSTLASCPLSNPQILHIGCGTSWLSFHLRAHVGKPDQVLNLDFSETAVELGRIKEADIYAEDEIGGRAVLSSAEEWRKGQSEREGMRWATADLLDFSSLVSATGSSAPQFSLILDKSTSDAIACAESISVSDAFFGMDAVLLDSKTLLNALSIQAQPPLDHKCSLDPMIVLSLHLAAITLPGGTWNALSYSQERFWFLEENASNDAEAEAGTKKIRSNSLDPKRFWSLEKKESMDVQEQNEPDTDVVYRPKIQHWLYMVVRTSESLP